MPLDDAKDEIRRIMDEATLPPTWRPPAINRYRIPQVCQGKISPRLELRIRLTSLELPPMNLVPNWPIQGGVPACAAT